MSDPVDTQMYLKNIRTVLVRPTHPGNIGGVARALKNMALETLYLVSAPADMAADSTPDLTHDFIGGAEARARASGADDVLARATVCASMDEALAGCSLIIGTSARARTITLPFLSPPQAAQRLVAAGRLGEVALLFGQERTGLTNAELDRCHFLVQIPINPGFSSLNLVCAVQILAYEIFLANAEMATAHTPALEADCARAKDEDLQRFYHHLEEVLIEIEFLDPANPRKLMRRLRRLFNRVALDHNEVNILRGILTAVQQRQAAFGEKTPGE